MLTTAQWASYRQVINAASASFNQQSIIWHRVNVKLDRQGDDSVKPTYTPIELKVLIQYNVFRTWPIDIPTDTGAIDGQSVMIFLNKDYLQANGYLDANNNFDYNADFDFFEIHGILYKKMGDLHGGQAGNDPVMFLIICERVRDNTNTLTLYPKGLPPPPPPPFGVLGETENNYFISEGGFPLQHETI